MVRPYLIGLMIYIKRKRYQSSLYSQYRDTETRWILANQGELLLTVYWVSTPSVTMLAACVQAILDSAGKERILDST